MKLMFGSFKVLIDAIDTETGEDVGIQVECNPRNGSFTMTTQIKERKNKAEVVDLTNDDSLPGDKKDDGKNDSFSSAGYNIPDYMFEEQDTLKEEAEESEESDNELEFHGRNNEKANASLVQSDTSSEYEAAIGFSQEVFTSLSYIPHMPEPRRSQRKNQKEGKKN